MKKQIFGAALAAIMAVGVGAVAQDQQGAPAQDQQKQGRWEHRGGHGKHGRMDPQARLDRMSQFLNLNEDQKARIKPILESENQQMQALKQDSSAKQDRRTKAMEIHKSTMDQIKPILNSDQQAKLDQQMQRMKERRRRHGRDGQVQPEGQSAQNQ